MATAESGLIRRIERMWVLQPFKKALAKRQREKVLLEQLDECIDKLFRNPSQPGLNLETLFQAGRWPVLSARINQACRVILVQLAKTEVGLLYFDSNHDEAYNWVSRNRADIPKMLERVEQLSRGVPVSSYHGPMPFVQFAEDVPLALTAAKQFHTMVNEGVARYLTYLDNEQRLIAELNVKDLLLVKGGAGTGKTAVALHRVLALAAKPTLPGFAAANVLYLCYNNLLAKVARQLLEGLYGGPLPETVQVQTFHTWCLEFLQQAGMPVPDVDEDRCQQLVYRAFGRLSQEQ
ncbi:MAG TPA: UvrD-helicase domain-containing protein [Herpetosiphonaceae bacterium]|nr:UvrD-helicase domain-containing protein [Herpetosiphonaceae bacterium]